jgi:phage-related protein
LQILEPISGLLAKLANGNPVLDRTVLYMLAAADAGKKLSGVFSGLSSGVAVLKGISSGVQDFSSGFQNASAAASDATGMWGTFGGKISSLGDMFKSAAVKMGILRAATVEGAEAQEGLDVAMDANPLGLIIIAVAGLVAGIVLLTTHCKAFRDFWKDVWSDIKVAFDDAFGFIKNNWQLILGILTFPIGGAVLIVMKYWGDIKNGFHDMFNDIKSWWPEIEAVLESPINLVVGFFEKLPGRIMSAVNDLPGLFKNLGVLIIDGLWNGVLSLGNWLWNQITSFVQSYVINPVKSILSIFSPSKVFHGFGANLVQGLALGINDNAHHAVSAVSSLSRMVAGAFNPQLTVPGAGSLAAAARGNVSNTFHIQVAGVVGDAAATGRQLAESLNEYLRQTGQPELVGGV